MDATTEKGPATGRSWRSAESILRFLGVSLIVLISGLILTTVNATVGAVIALIGLIGIMLVVYTGGFVAK